MQGKNTFIFLMLVLVAIVAGLFGFLLNQPTSPILEEVDYDWIEFFPIKCNLNPWEIWHESLGRVYVRAPTEEEIIKEYFEVEYNIKIEEILIKANSLESCDECSCPRGDSVYLLASTKDIDKLNGLGFIGLLTLQQNNDSLPNSNNFVDSELIFMSYIPKQCNNPWGDSDNEELSIKNFLDSLGVEYFDYRQVYGPNISSCEDCSCAKGYEIVVKVSPKDKLNLEAVGFSLWNPLLELKFVSKRCSPSFFESANGFSNLEKITNYLDEQNLNFYGLTAQPNPNPSCFDCGCEESEMYIVKVLESESSPFFELGFVRME